MKETAIYVTKANGEKEFFSSKKLLNSLYKAGADNSTANYILREIEKSLHNGVSTKKIYSTAFLMLKKERNAIALRYKLKQAIMELGPTGFPFEQFIGKLFESQGYTTKVSVTTNGACVQHEIDVIATKNKDQLLIECKYSQDRTKNVGIQIPLYVYSRVNDIIDYRKNQPEYDGYRFKAGLITNTRFSSESLQYATCKQMYLLSWSYPVNNGLKELIEKNNMYPITVLNSLSKKQTSTLLDLGIVTCKQLLENDDWQQALNLTIPKLKLLYKELSYIS